MKTSQKFTAETFRFLCLLRLYQFTVALE